MVFKVDYEKVSNVSSYLVEKTEKLQSLYFDIIKICKEIDDNWSSDDSSVYIYKFISFIENKMKENENLNMAGHTLKEISSIYFEQEKIGLNNILRTDFGKGRMN